MSQAKLEKTLPLIENAAKVLVKDLIKPGKEYDTKEISSAYTIKAIMSSGFSIGKILLSLEFYSWTISNKGSFHMAICRDPRIRPSEARSWTNQKKSLGGHY